MTTEQIRVLLVGDPSLVQIGIDTLLGNTKEDITLVGTVGDSNEVGAFCQTVQPNVVIFASMPYRIQAIRQLIHECPAIKVLVVRVDEDERRLKELVDNGVLGCFQHNEPPKKFVEALCTVAQGKPWFSHSLYTKSAHLRINNITYGLTEQELNVLQLVVVEKTDREIAQTLNLSERNVRRILRCIYDKVGVNSRAGAAFQAGMLGLLTENSQ